MSVRALFLLAATLLSTAAIAEDPSGEAVQRALAAARVKHTPVLVDFSAPWCYSCYFMKSHVLNGPEWERAGRETTIVELDADSPEGAKWMAAWSVKAMPTYLVFDTSGQELGRILGEQTRGEFYHWLFALTGRGSALESLKAKAVDGSEASLVAAREVLRAYHERYDANGGLTWFAGLARPVKSAIARDDNASTWIARLELQRAVAEKDVAGCMNVAPMVLNANLGCERPYEIEKVMACTESRPADERGILLRPQVDYMNLLVDKRVLSPLLSQDTRCADERSIIVTTADLDQLLGKSDAEKQVLDRAITDVQQRLGDELKQDRNLADNLRVYLDRAGRVKELDALYPKLIAAYPDDYVYAARYAKSLAARGMHAEALPYFEQAAAKAYGVNRLRNAEARAKSLHELNRDKDARTVLGEALQANGSLFPDDAARVKALLDSLPAA